MGKRRIGVSKNRKKAWNKFCNIEDVKNYLQEEIKDDILGGSARKKTNSELFFVDKIVNNDGKDKKSLWRNKPLRCHQILQSFSKVAVPIKPNKVKNIQPTKQKDDKDEAKSCNNHVKVENSKLPSPTKEIYDIWDTKEPSVSGGVLDEDLENYYLKQVKKRGRKVPALFYEKPSILTAVEAPRPGTSYNPTFQDHQKLLEEALKVELSKKKAEQKLIRALDNKFPDKSEAPTQETWLKEMSQGILDGGEKNESDEEIDSTAPLTINPPVRADKRKSANKRRKEKAMKVAAKKVEMKKKETLRSNEIFRIKSLTAEVLEEKYQQQMKLMRKRIRKASRAHLPARLSKYRYEAPDLELKLSEELTGSLRTLKAEGSVLHDRFKSFQRRNIIDCRIKQKKPKRKHKLKVFKKRGFEDEPQ